MFVDSVYIMFQFGLSGGEHAHAFIYGWGAARWMLHAPCMHTIGGSAGGGDGEGRGSGGLGAPGGDGGGGDGGGGGGGTACKHTEPPS